jgi:hypothetical protein
VFLGRSESEADDADFPSGERADLQWGGKGTWGAKCLPPFFCRFGGIDTAFFGNGMTDGYIEIII